MDSGELDVCGLFHLVLYSWGADRFFVGYVLAGVVAGSAFGIIMMTKGAVGKGVRMLLCRWVGLPVLIILGKAAVAMMTDTKL